MINFSPNTIYHKDTLNTKNTRALVHQLDTTLNYYRLAVMDQQNYLHVLKIHKEMDVNNSVDIKLPIEQITVKINKWCKQDGTIVIAKFCEVNYTNPIPRI